MLFSRMGLLIAIIVALYGMFDLVWIFGFQYSFFFDPDFDPSIAGQSASEIGLLNEIGVAFQRIGYAVALGVLSEISISLKSNRSS